MDVLDEELIKFWRALNENNHGFKRSGRCNWTGKDPQYPAPI